MDFIKQLKDEIENWEMDIFMLKRKRERFQAVYQKHLVCGIPDTDIEHWETHGCRPKSKDL